MTKKLCTILLSACVGLGMFAQEHQCSVAKECATFAPRKGQWEVSLILGKSGNVYSDNQVQLINQNIRVNGGSVGLPNGSYADSGYLDGILNIDGLNGNSLIDIVGVQGKYFWQDCWSVSLSAGMNISATPKKDYVESMVLDKDLDSNRDLVALPSQKYINATATSNMFVNVGMERYFKTKNKRIFPYVGAAVGFQMARIETREPYTGKWVNIDNMQPVTPTIDNIANSDGNLVEEQVFIPAGRIGQMFALKGAAVAGVEYDLMPGMFLALEFQPLAYRYDVIQIAPQGFDHYNVCHHNIKVFDMPTVRIGFRF